MNPRSHHKGATGRVRTGDQLLPVLCHCQLGQDIYRCLCKSIDWLGATQDGKVVADSLCLLLNLNPGHGQNFNSITKPQAIDMQKKKM